MRSKALILFLAVLFVAFGGESGIAAPLAIAPTTTLTAQTSNNTSASDGFKLLPDGDTGATNVSRESIQKLLPGTGTKVYAHLMPWFGVSSHMNIGYDSADPAQCAKQVKDMHERGLDGAIIDWYGPANHSDNATKCFFAAALNQPGFEVAVMVDRGALGGSDPTAKLISALQYAEKNYFSQPTYMRRNNLPVVPFFGVESVAVDWARVKAAINPLPLFVYENANGYGKSLSDGAFAWVQPTSTDPSQEAITYLGNFYAASLQHSTKLTFGAAYAGFNDTLALWSKNRIISRNCGKTFLDTFAPINSFYVSGHALADLQMVTWNDYEEGTELESGIENCASVQASVTRAALNWSPGPADPLTIDHYTVYASTDGENLMKLLDVDNHTASLDLSKFSFTPGTYKLYVQAIGAPFMTNHMSNVVSYTVAPPPPPTPIAAVHFTAPANGATVFSPVTVSATMTAPNGCVSIKIYVDSTLRYGNINSTSIHVALAIPSGQHKITVQFWDKSGTVTKSSVLVNVK